MKQISLLVLFFVLAHLAFAQDQIVVKYVNTITQENLKKHLAILASDAYEGRNTGEKGLEMAAKYLETKFAGNELTGPVTSDNDPFYQEFDLERKTWTKIIFTSGNIKFEQGKDLFLLNMTEGTNEYDLVFAGFGIYSDKYNDYTNIDVKGKIVAFLLDEPKTQGGKYLVTGTDTASIKVDTSLMKKLMSMQPKAMACMMRGAKGIIIIEPDDKVAEKTIMSLNENMGSSQMNFPGKSDMMPPVPIIYMSHSNASKIFGTSNKKFDKAIKEKVEKGESPSGLFNVKIKIEAERKTETIKTGNVIGMIEGSDKKDEYITLTAHYDHLGTINGEVYNGADDNGSGTVALIELAEAFAQAKADGHGPRRSILFIALTGEEKGLFGSKYYTEHPVFSMSNTVTDLNVDMVGRIDKEHKGNGNYVYVIGDDRLSNELHQTSENTAKLYMPDLELNYKYNAKDDPEHLYERSDQYNFAQKGVPVIFYTGGEHDDYHKPTDDVDKIDFPSYQKRLQLIFATAWQLANADEKVKVDK